MSGDPAKVGRSGRGAALLQLLNNPVRKPGATAPEEGASSNILPTPTLPATPQVRPVGRGAAVELLRQKEIAKAQEERQCNLKAEGVIPSQVVGRGRAAILKSLQESNPLSGFASELTSALLSSGVPSPKIPSTSTKVQPMTFETAGKRPDPVIKRGTEGVGVPLCANYIPLRCTTEGVFQYHTFFEPLVDCRRMRSKMINEHLNVLGKTSAFDGLILFLPKRLEQEPTTLKSVRDTDKVEVTITIKLVKVLAPEDCIHLYNVIFRKIMSKLEMCQIGRNSFLPGAGKILHEHKLEIWPGYVTAVSEYEGGVMLMTDVSHRVLRTQTALELIIELMNRNPESSRDDVHKLLIGNAVLTRYNNRVYRIDDINWSMTPMSQFTLYSGEKMTFLDYYKKMYNITIEDLQQPLLVSIPKKKDMKGDREQRVPDIICLIPELSYMTGLTDAMRKDFKVMKELAEHTRLNPAMRHVSLRNFCRKVNQIPEARHELERWGFTLDMDIMEVEGRVLNPETIILAGRELNSEGADWSKAVCRAPVITPVHLNNWLLLVTNKDSKRAEDFITTYLQCSRDMGINVRRPNLVLLNNDRTETYIREIRSKLNENVQIVVTIFPSQREDRYSAIKQICCIDMPVPSQVINSFTISDPRKLRSVTQKIALQINCKLGGELWAVKIPTKMLMVCGIDVFHSPGRTKSSVVGFVSSMNVTCTRWYSKVRIQEPGEELISSLKVCFVDALRKYYEVNHQLPGRIVIYRDGVGDGQLKVVQEFEVEQLKECFHNFSELDYQPKMAVIVVQKRINARLLAKEMNGNLINPLPGTVVDHTITRRNWYDFFLVSQQIRQGTVSPTHYVVVLDDLGWKTDIVQALTYKMTHLYYNWPGTIRVPAPCQYAHKLAYLVGQNIKKEPDSQLCERLFFL